MKEVSSNLRSSNSQSSYKLINKQVKILQLLNTPSGIQEKFDKIINPQGEFKQQSGTNWFFKVHQSNTRSEVLSLFSLFMVENKGVEPKSFQDLKIFVKKYYDASKLANKPLNYSIDNSEKYFNEFIDKKVSIIKGHNGQVYDLKQIKETARRIGEAWGKDYFTILPDGPLFIIADLLKIGSFSGINKKTRALEKSFKLKITDAHLNNDTKFKVLIKESSSISYKEINLDIPYYKNQSETNFKNREKGLEILKAIKNPKQIERLTLKGCRLYLEDLDILTKFENLTHLNIELSDIKTKTFDSKNFVLSKVLPSTITHLDISGRGLDMFKTVEQLGAFPNITHLKYTGKDSYFEGNYYPSIFNFSKFLDVFSNLEYLDISETGISISDFDETKKNLLDRFKKLKYLNTTCDVLRSNLNKILNMFLKQSDLGSQIKWIS